MERIDKRAKTVGLVTTSTLCPITKTDCWREVACFTHCTGIAINQETAEDSQVTLPPPLPTIPPFSPRLLASCSLVLTACWISFTRSGELLLLMLIPSTTWDRLELTLSSQCLHYSEWHRGIHFLLFRHFHIPSQLSKWMKTRAALSHSLFYCIPSPWHVSRELM